MGKRKGNRQREAFKRARGKVSIMLQRRPLYSTRVSSTNNSKGKMYTTMSGAGGRPNASPLVTQLFESMLEGHNVKQENGYDPGNCAEAHLWIIIKEGGDEPKRYDILTKSFKKEDDPCVNCRKWVYEEFGTVNRQAIRPDRLL